MMNLRRFFLTLLAAIAVSSLSGQMHQILSAPDMPRQMTAGGRGVFMDGERISAAEAIRYAKADCPEALRYIRTGRFVGGTAYGLATLGGTAAGWGIGSLFEEDAAVGPSLFLIGAGAVIFGGAVGLASISAGRYRKGAALYNDAVLSGFAGRRSDKVVSISMTGTRGGLGLQLVF